ncbi:para-nitrobenzyl esterase [Chitinophaga costaii]|uniref:Carboxylic ester hydrolase n=1 Tax=Chitinophaga costaii TaxID=1335309 RepID=A0A1C4EHS0_9BACT|nr:carboxylesterase/lipase family protein [Chitinophaga costaii]PUZ23815.1 carboxylesterase/lipase family protein [Chitinophaga costaii]SCC43115.1 para-nitrobenzyl esterase [Chitinophaga costaii]
MNMNLSPIINTVAGKLQGKAENDCFNFKGIPYGESTGGVNRFKPPVPKAPWQGVLEAVNYGNSAPQGILKMGGANAAAKVDNAEVNGVIQAMLDLAGLSAIPVQFDEDCLYLNVFTSGTDNKKRPVMVWLHGGGFSVGSSASVAFDGSFLCKKEGVVVVTLNHRLGAAGFLNLGEFDEAFADAANAGMLDIVLALKWVQQHIAAFGGDPGNVTIFGQSGGGRKVSVLMAMPEAQGLFHKAIVQSGSAERIIPLAASKKVSQLVADKLGITKDNASKFQELPLYEIFKVVSEVEFPVNNFSSVVAPAVDGRNVLTDPFYPKAPADSANIPLLIGTDLNEMTTFLIGNPLWLNYSEEQARQHAARVVKVGDKAYSFYKQLLPDASPAYVLEAVLSDATYWYGSVVTAESKSKQQAAPVFMYRMDYQSSALGKCLKSPHGIEIPFVFGNTEFGEEILAKGPSRDRLTAVMSNAWANFARSGNPSSAQLQWPAYTTTDRKTMIFNDPIELVNDPEHERRMFWEANYF